MKHSLSMLHLSFYPGTILHSPGIISALENSPSFSQLLDHFMECHLTSDFGELSRAMRFDNVKAVISRSGQITSRFYLHHTISPPHTGVIIITSLDDYTTAIRFVSKH